jgi:NAD(P)-dependent dehydrogenase (short-subunit alcohol dehydrogenase family)
MPGEKELTAFGGGVAVVTGAGSGIGEGLARYAATSLGMTVVLADINAEAINALAEELISEGARAVAVPTDVRHPDSVERLADASFDISGDVRLLVNNAGVEQFGYLWDTPVENWDRLVAINISGVFYGIRAFLPRMIAANDSPTKYVLNLSSLGGVGAAPLQAPYIMSKHAVLSITECLYLEVELVKADIRVAAVLPGVVVTNIFQSARGVDGSADVTAAEDQRAAMMEVREGGMTVLAAAETIFSQAADGEFFILTQPEMIGAAMARRADQLRDRHPPRRRTAPR